MTAHAEMTTLAPGKTTPEVHSSAPQGNNLRNILHDDAITFIKQCPKTGRHFAGIIGTRIIDVEPEDLQSVGSCTTKSAMSGCGRMRFGDCSTSPTPSSIFPTDVSTMASPTPSSLYPYDVSAFTSPAAPSIYPRDVATLTSPKGFSIFPRDVSTLASPMAPSLYPVAMDDEDTDSESENGTLSGSENGLESPGISDDEEESDARTLPQAGGDNVSAPSQAPWKSWPRRAESHPKEDAEQAPEQRCADQHEQRWRIAGSRLACIFQEHSDSDGSLEEPPRKQEKLSVATGEHQDQRWRIAGKRLAAIFQEESDSEGSVPAGVLRAC